MHLPEFVCGLYAHECRSLQSPDVRCPGVRFSDSYLWGTWHGCWGPSWGPLQEQYISPAANWCSWWGWMCIHFWICSVWVTESGRDRDYGSLKKLAIKSTGKKEEDSAEPRDFFHHCDKDKKIRKKSSHACLNLMNPFVPDSDPASPSPLRTSALPAPSSVTLSFWPSRISRTQTQCSGYLQSMAVCFCQVHLCKWALVPVLVSVLLWRNTTAMATLMKASKLGLAYSPEV